MLSTYPVLGIPATAELYCSQPFLVLLKLCGTKLVLLIPKRVVTDPRIKMLRGQDGSPTW